jgi:hypothetical protein
MAAPLPSFSATTVPRETLVVRAWSRPLLRTAAAIYALFAIGHTLGAMLNDTRRGPRQAELFAAMRAYVFDVQGMTRSYWDFYRGFGFMVTVLLALTAALCWVLADMGKTHPREARRVLHVIVVAMGFTTWFSFVDFFAAPMVFSAVAMVILVTASIALGREGARQSTRRTIQ